MTDFTIVVGISGKYLDQFKLVWPTWVRHKPSLMDRKWVVFFDREENIEGDIHRIIGNDARVVCYPWPWGDVTYEGNPDIKWYHPQRYKMLAGFVHLPAVAVDTPYWLKLDVDVVATGDDKWIDPAWIDPESGPAIVSSPWAYTKPPEQMVQLDMWVEAHADALPDLAARPPLNIVPEPGADLVRHRNPSRIISRCAFFQAEFTKRAHDMADHTCGRFKLPVPSQDGFHWYVAHRLGLRIELERMQQHGWKMCSTFRTIRSVVQEAMA